MCGGCIPKSKDCRGWTGPKVARESSLFEIRLLGVIVYQESLKTPDSRTDISSQYSTTRLERCPEDVLVGLGFNIHNHERYHILIHLL